MLLTAVAFWELVLALHILAVVVAFGVTFAYPIFGLVGRRLVCLLFDEARRLGNQTALGRNLAPALRWGLARVHRRFHTPARG